jgi:hypothetical protein
VQEADLALRSIVLGRLSILVGAIPPEREKTLAAAAAAWNDLAQRGWNEATDDPALADFLGMLGCQGENAPYVARGLKWRIETAIHGFAGFLRMSPTGLEIKVRFDKPYKMDRLYASRLVNALRDPGCAGARGLTPEETVWLNQIAAAAPKPDAAPPSQRDQSSEAARSQ